MNDHPYTLILDIFRFMFVGMLILASIFLLSIPISALGSSGSQPTNANAINTGLAHGMSESPNYIARGVANGLNEASKLTGPSRQSAANNVKAVVRGVATGTSGAVRGTGRGATAATHALGSGVATVAGGIGTGFAVTFRGIGTGFGFMFSIPGKIFRVTHISSAVNYAVRPSDYTEVPVIDPQSPELYEAIASLPPVQPTQAAPQTNAGPVWPIHGKITTQFGVPHWPYQRVHSGIDISDGAPSGRTPIKPFRSGKVLEAGWGGGLGNRVVVDHGNNVTSVYGHMSSVAVQVGQDVTVDTALGLEGSTGRSTGTHLHFEVRVNGQVADPHNFIPGQPY